MRRIRPATDAPAPEAAVQSPASVEPQQQDGDGLEAIVEIARESFAQMVETTRAAAEKMQPPAVKPQPTAFKITVTERDKRGRIVSVDVEVKESNG